MQAYGTIAASASDAGSMPDPATELELTGEALLVDRAKKGDAAAFTQLVERYERRVYRLARHITQHDEDAEDVLQEVFLKAYTRRYLRGQFEVYLAGPHRRPADL
ncbi:MAG: sigma factor [Bryobacteraceae bacterium]